MRCPAARSCRPSTAVCWTVPNSTIRAPTASWDSPTFPRPACCRATTRTPSSSRSCSTRASSTRCPPRYARSSSTRWTRPRRTWCGSRSTGIPRTTSRCRRRTRCASTRRPNPSCAASSKRTMRRSTSARTTRCSTRSSRRRSASRSASCAGTSIPTCAARWRTTITSAKARSRLRRRPERKAPAGATQTPSGIIAGWCLYFGGRGDAEAAAFHRQGEHLRRPRLLMADRAAYALHFVGGFFALRARRAARVGLRRHDHDVRHALHDGGRVHAVAERPRARRRAVRLLPPAHAGDDRPHPLHRVLHSGRVRADLRRLLLRRRLVAHQRALEHHLRGPGDLPVQDHHPGRRCLHPDSGHRRDRALHHLFEDRRVALARGRRRRSRCRQTEGNGPREGRGHPAARPVRRAAPGGDAMKLRKELWFGFSLMGMILIAILVFTPWTHLTNGHLGLIMLALIVVAIMLGYPTAFTLMGLGVFFAWLAYRSANPATATQQVLDLMVQRSYGVMSNDVLIAVPLFVFMGYLVERAALIDRLFRSLHLATARVPGSLAVATIITCAIFATATGIVGAIVTLMGLLAFPAMLKAGYNVKISAGAVTAGGCLGILIPPSVLLIVYGATAGVSVVQLYAGAFFPGFMLAALYLGYVIVLAKWNPALMPPLSESERRIALPTFASTLSARGRNAFGGLWSGSFGGVPGVPKRTVVAQLFVTLLPALFVAGMLILTYRAATAPEVVENTAGLQQFGSGGDVSESQESTDLATPAEDSGTGLAEPPTEAAAAAPQADAEQAGAEREKRASDAAEAKTKAAASEVKERLAVPTWFWITVAVCALLLAALYWLWTWERLEVFKYLLTSFFPLAVLILLVLGSIVFGLATPTEAAAVGALGGLILAAAYRFIEHWRAASASARGAAVTTTLRELGNIVKESSFLTAKTSAMVCWLFVGSAIFSAAFALLGGQEIVEKWVLSLNMTPVQFMILAQFIIFILGWPLEWTEIIVIFMPIFIPLLPHFGIDPLFFGLLVALNLQTAFLPPPVAMAAFYLKGVAPKHVTLNQIFAGMMPFMAIQVLAVVLLYIFPGIGLWLPSVVYGR